MKIKILILCLAWLLPLSLLLNGCSELPRKSPVATQSVGTTYCYISTPTNNPNFFRTAYENASTNETNQEIIRAEIAYEVMGMIDAEYKKFEQRLRRDREYKDVLASFISIGLSSAATVTGASDVKTILSAIDTGVKGANAAVDAEVFRDKASEAIISQMQASRAKIATQIVDGLKMPIKDYPLQALQRDLQAYYDAGNVTSALVDLFNQATLNANDQKQKLANARGLDVTNFPSALNQTNSTSGH